MSQLNSEKKTAGRKSYLDILRIIACIMVLYHHTPAAEFYRSAVSWHKLVYGVPAMLVRADVPIFFMISGTLLLGRKTEWKDVMKKVLRFTLTLVFWDLFLFIGYDVVVAGTPVNFNLFWMFLRRFLEGMVSGSSPYWYIYGYIGFLLMLPFIQKMCDTMSSRDYLVILILHAALWTLVPISDFICQMRNPGYWPLQMDDAFEVPLAAQKAFFFTITGFYIDRHIDVTKNKKKTLLLAFGAILLSVLLMGFMTMYQGRYIRYTNDYVQTFDYVMAAGFFIAAKVIFDGREPEKLKKAAVWLSSLTFGIYLMDPVWHMLLDPTVRSISVDKPVLPFAVLWVILSALVGGFLTWLFRKIPVLKKLV